MTVQQRIERWRELTQELALPVEGIPEHIRLREARRVSLCAAELEADLRELREVVERVPHSKELVCPAQGLVERSTGEIEIDAGYQVCRPDCARCALEARIGLQKEK